MVPRMRMRKKTACLILTETKKQPEPKNQPAPQPKHEVREFKHPHPHKEHKKMIAYQRLSSKKEDLKVIQTSLVTVKCNKQIKSKMRHTYIDSFL